ncbi:hypothetical protein GCM10007103_10560 [Salinimicrobium marinum]|uniref:CarboxypepD_reg-like domain-containing protein n=1 Tax=Salinimicrobium marinum TaxID=680283 RepID=A0A918SB99_9FLAO|nr:hypothetical protein GCM10007103_10560 [Salinimicrobium marinum]
MSIFSCSIYAQEREFITAKVVKNDSVMENVHVNNVSAKKFSVSNKKGLFFIDARAGDTLVLSHVSTRDFIKFLSEEDFESDLLLIRMEDNANELDEVILNEYSHINVVSVGIVDKKVEILSENERRLRTAGDFKPIHLLGLLGGSLEIDPILNAINGRTKRLKRNIKIEKKENNIALLRNQFSDYMRKTMELSDEEILQLINFAVEEPNFQIIVDSENEEQLKLFLHDTWFKFQKLRS